MWPHIWSWLHHVADTLQIVGLVGTGIAVAGRVRASRKKRHDDEDDA